MARRPGVYPHLDHVHCGVPVAHPTIDPGHVITLTQKIGDRVLTQKAIVKSVRRSEGDFSFEPGMYEIELIPTESSIQPLYIEKEKGMQAVIHRNTKNRTVDISIEVDEETFLDSDNKKVKREIGEDMPIYTSMPAEVYDAIAHNPNVCSPMSGLSVRGG